MKKLLFIAILALAVCRSSSAQMWSDFTFVGDTSTQGWSSVQGIAQAITNGGTYTNDQVYTNTYRLCGTNYAGRIPMTTNISVVFTGSVLSNNAVSLSWTRKGGISRHVIEKSLDAGSTWTNHLTLGPGVTSWIDNGSNTWTAGSVTSLVSSIPDMIVPWQTSSTFFGTSNNAVFASNGVVALNGVTGTFYLVSNPAGYTNETVTNGLQGAGAYITNGQPSATIASMLFDFLGNPRISHASGMTIQSGNAAMQVDAANQAYLTLGTDTDRHGFWAVENGIDDNPATGKLSVVIGDRVWQYNPSTATWYMMWSNGLAFSGGNPVNTNTVDIGTSNNAAWSSNQVLAINGLTNNFVLTNDTRVAALPGLNRMSNVWVDASGQVGVGTNTPATTLDVNGDATIRGNLTLPTAGSAIYGGTRQILKYTSGDNVTVGDVAEGIDLILSAGANSARLLASGKFGIGTNTPATTIDVNGEATIRGLTSVAALSTTGTIQQTVGVSYYNYVMGWWGIKTNTPATPLDVNGNATVRGELSMTKDGMVIGFVPKSAAPYAGSSQLQIDNTTGTSSGLVVNCRSGGSAPYNQFVITDSSRYILPNSPFLVDLVTARVGIGTNAPATTLDVNGAATIRGNLIVTNATSITMSTVPTVGGNPFLTNVTYAGSFSPFVVTNTATTTINVSQGWLQQLTLTNAATTLSVSTADTVPGQISSIRLELYIDNKSITLGTNTLLIGTNNAIGAGVIDFMSRMQTNRYNSILFDKGLNETYYRAFGLNF